MPGPARQSSWWKKNRSLETLLEKFNGSKASDPRDLVYALLGISSDAENTNYLRPDYTKTVQEVICNTAEFIIGHSNISYDRLATFLRGMPTLRHAYYGAYEVDPNYIPDTTEEIESAAADEKKNGKNNPKLLLDHHGARIRISEAVVIAAANNQESGPEVMELLLRQRGIEVKITKAVLMAAAKNPRSALQLMKLLLQRRGAELRSSGALEATATSRMDIMALILDNCDASVQITGDVVAAAGRNEGSGKDIVILLFDYCIAVDDIRHDTALAIFQYFDIGLITLLLKRCSADAQITKSVAAAIVKKFGLDTVALFFDSIGVDFSILQRIVVEAAKDDRTGYQILALLLERQGSEVLITQEVVVAAAGNYQNSEAIMILLLDRCDANIHITEDVVVAAARNSHRGEAIIGLLNRRGAEIRVTESVLATAIGNLDYFGLTMEPRPNRRNTNTQVTECDMGPLLEEYISGERIMALLRNHYDAQDRIRKEFLEATMRFFRE